MNRRGFLKGLLAASATIATYDPTWEAGKKLISIPSKKIYTGHDFIIDRATGNIRWVGPKHKKYTVLEFHRWLQEKADDYIANDSVELDITDQNPSVACTPNIIELVNGYNIDDKVAEHLRGGSITQDSGKTLFSGFRTVGIVNDTSIVTIDGVPAPNPGHVDQCIRRERGKKVTVSVSTPGNTYSSYDAIAGYGITIAPLFEGKDLFYDNPKDSPIYELEKELGPPKSSLNNFTTAAQRLAWKQT